MALIIKDNIPIPSGEPLQLGRRLKLEEVDYNRNFECDEYEVCLEYAASYYWESFSCGGCPKWTRGIVQNVDEDS